MQNVFGPDPPGTPGTAEMTENNQNAAHVEKTHLDAPRCSQLYFGKSIATPCSRKCVLELNEYVGLHPNGDHLQGGVIARGVVQTATMELENT